MYKTLLGVNSFISKKNNKPGLMLHTSQNMSQDEAHCGQSVKTYFVMCDNAETVFGRPLDKIDFKSLLGASIDMYFTDSGFLDSVRLD